LAWQRKQAEGDLSLGIALNGRNRSQVRITGKGPADQLLIPQLQTPLTTERKISRIRPAARACGASDLEGRALGADQYREYDRVISGPTGGLLKGRMPVNQLHEWPLLVGAPEGLVKGTTDCRALLPCGAGQQRNRDTTGRLKAWAWICPGLLQAMAASSLPG